MERAIECASVCVRGGDDVDRAANLPTSKVACDNQGINWSLVIVNTTKATDSKGATSGWCKDSSGKFTQFVIEIYARQANGSLRNWRAAANTIGSNEWDLVQTMTHEFGHTLGMGHPSDGNYAVMVPTTMGQNRQRDLYWWDLVCGRQRSPHRTTKGYRRSHLGGVFGAETNLLGGSTMANASVGVNWLSHMVDRSIVGKREDCMVWGRTALQGGTNCLVGTDAHSDKRALFTEAVYREDTSVSNVFFSMTDEEPSNGNVNAVHRVHHHRSANGFRTMLSGVVSECSVMNSFMACRSGLAIASSKQVAVSWDNHTNRTVFAWVNQNRLNNAATGQVRVAVGNVLPALLPTADTIWNVRSSVAPGLACEANAVKNCSGVSYDCMIALVAPDNPAMTIRVYRFSAVQSGLRYVLNVSPDYWEFANIAIVSRIAAWRHNGRFWLAYRDLAANQNLGVVSSVDTNGWSVTSVPSYTDVGPSAVSYWNSDNEIVFVK